MREDGSLGVYVEITYFRMSSLYINYLRKNSFKLENLIKYISFVNLSLKTYSYIPKIYIWINERIFLNNIILFKSITGLFSTNLPKLLTIIDFFMKYFINLFKKNDPYF